MTTKVTADLIDSSDAADFRTALAVAGTGVANTFTANQTIQSTDAGAGEGPLLTLDRNSASPANADVLGGIVFKGRDDGAAEEVYAKIYAVIADVTGATEDGQLTFDTVLAGALATRFKLRGGLYANGLTDPGDGKINANGFQIGGVAGAAHYLEYREEQASATDGGTFTTGAWQTRVINTEVADTGSHGSVAANQITLAAGTYECWIACPAVLVNEHQAKLYNVTDAADTLLGPLAYSNTGGGPALVVGRFTIAAQKVFEVRHRGAVTRATDGFGAAGGWGTEVYTVARFWKVA